MLIRGNWQEDLYQALTELIDSRQEQNSYAVFDWDNTCIINDIGEAVFNYQIRNLAFSFTPRELSEGILQVLPEGELSELFSNQLGKRITVNEITTDITKSYQELYRTYNGFDGEQTLVTVKKSAAYEEFRTKLRFLYEGIGQTYSADISYPWVTFFLAGKTPEEIHHLTVATLEEELQMDLTYQTLKSPEIVSESGIVRVDVKRGIRLIPEIQNLMKELKAKGISVYIVSASNREVILPFATRAVYGYDLAENQIFGMELMEKNGRLEPKLNQSFAQTQGRGKTETILQLISAQHNHQSPILVAGDSDGDVPMLTDFTDTIISLIIDRQKEGGIGEVVKLGKESKRYFVQGRDENTGMYMDSVTSRLLNKM